MNSTIEAIFENFEVDEKAIPISFLYYEGDKETYLTYQNIDIDGTLIADDEVVAYGDYYDIDIFSNGNFLKIVKEVKKIMKANGFLWIPSRTSEDLYEEDTGMYHKTLCFAIEKEEEE